MMVSGIIGAIVGGIFGFFIGRYFSKFGGVCPLLCNPKISTFYFALLGFLLAYKNF
ncbi:MAG: YtxH domain-containing protein [Candidatus Kryptonium sp.]